MGHLRTYAKPAKNPLIVSPVEFKLLFTSSERIAIKAHADPHVKDFFEILDDPRLTEVNLGLQSTQEAVARLVFLNLVTQARAEAIMTGVLV